MPVTPWKYYDFVIVIPLIPIFLMLYTSTVSLPCRQYSSIIILVHANKNNYYVIVRYTKGV